MNDARALILCLLRTPVEPGRNIVYESTNDFSFMERFGPPIGGGGMEGIHAQLAHYQPVLRFVLIDPDERLFAPERYCFRGSVDDWISIGRPDAIDKLAAKYMKHLGQDSFYELF